MSYDNKTNTGGMAKSIPGEF